MSAPAQRNFTAGEVSPTVHARADLALYRTAVKKARNVTVLRTGGLQNAAGTEYLGSTKNDGVARLVEAVFDDDEGYVLEFGNLYVRFWLDGALVQGTVTGAWSSGSVAYTAGVVVSHSGTNYVCLVAHTSSALNEPGTAGGAEEWYALSGTIYELPTPYTTAQLDVMQVKVTALDVVTIVHPSHEPATLTRTSNAVWELADIDFADSTSVPTNLAVSGTGGSGVGYTVTAVVDGSESTAPAIVRTNIPTGDIFTIGADLAATPRTVSWTAVSGASEYKIYIDWLGTGLANFLTTTALTSFVHDHFFGPSSFATPPTSSGSFAAAGELPSVVGAYQQRLILAGADNTPDVAQASQTAIPYNFDVSDPIVDSDAMSWRQVGTRLNRIRHFEEVAQRLIQFSSAGESIIQGDVSGILRPGEVNPRQISANGSAVYPSPLAVNDTALYVQARGGIVRDLAPASESFAGTDLTLLSAHLVDGYTITDWCYQQTPNSVVWMVRSDGKLLALTYVRELGIVGWATRDTDGEFLSVACVPENGRDAVYAVVERHPLPTAWNNANTPTQSYLSSAYSPSLGVAVLLGDNQTSSTNVAAYGTTGAAWSSTTAGTTAYSYKAVVWFEAADLFVGVSVSSGQSANGISSPTGATWTTRTLEDGNWQACFNATVADVPCVIALGTTKVGITLNGTSWNTVTATGDYNQPLRGCWADALEAAYAVNGDNTLIRSTDLTAWTVVVTGLAAFTYTDIKWVGDRLVAMAGSSVVWSIDGTTWTEVEVGGGDELSYDETSDRLFVYDQNSEPTFVAASMDRGLTWTTLPDPEETFDEGYYTGVYLPEVERFVLAGSQATTTEAAYLQYPQTSRYVERFTDRLADAPVLMDASVVYSGIPTTTIDDLDHLEGMQVSVIADGVVVGSPNNPSYETVYTVTDGEIELENAASDVTVGLPFVSDIQTLDLDSPSVTVKDAGINIKRVGLWLNDSDTPFVGPAFPTSDTAVSDSTTTMYRMPCETTIGGTLTTPPISGYREVTTEGQFNRSGSIAIRHVDPTPLEILAIVPQGKL